MQSPACRASERSPSTGHGAARPAFSEGTFTLPGWPCHQASASRDRRVSPACEAPSGPGTRPGPARDVREPGLWPRARTSPAMTSPSLCSCTAAHALPRCLVNRRVWLRRPCLWFCDSDTFASCVKRHALCGCHCLFQHARNALCRNGAQRCTRDWLRLFLALITEPRLRRAFASAPQSREPPAACRPMASEEREPRGRLLVRRRGRSLRRCGLPRPWRGQRDSLRRHLANPRNRRIGRGRRPMLRRAWPRPGGRGRHHQ